MGSWTMAGLLLELTNAPFIIMVLMDPTKRDFAREPRARIANQPVAHFAGTIGCASTKCHVINASRSSNRRVHLAVRLFEFTSQVCRDAGQYFVFFTDFRESMGL